MNTPTLQELFDNIMNAFEDRFGIILRGFKSTFRAIAIIFSGQLKQAYLTAAKVQKNVFPDLADPEIQGGTLERFGRARLGRDRFPASQGEYILDVTGEVGGTIQEGQTYKSNNGYIYRNQSTYVITGTSDTITVTALTAGTVATLEVGEILSATSPILNVNSEATVNQESVSPIDEETIEDYRDVILQSFRIEAQGGSSADFRLWSLDAQGVRTSYPFTPLPGDVDLYVESTDNDGVPTQTILDAVQAVVEQDPDTTKPPEQRGRIPITVFTIQYLPVTLIDVDIELTGFTGNVGDFQTRIEGIVNTYLYDVRPYVAGVDLADNSTLFATRLSGVISNEIGLEANFEDLILTVDGNIVDSFQFLEGNIPLLDTLTLTP